MGALPLFCRWAAGLACRCWRCCLRRLRWRWASRCPPFCWAAAAAGVLGGVLLRRGVRLRGMAKDADCGALWACILPVALITLYLLHTHVLHMVNGAYHTGQSCYGDMPMHLGFIKYIAQSGEFLPCYPLLGGEHGSGIRSCARLSPAYFWCWGRACALRIFCRCCPHFCRCTVCSGSWPAG